MPEDYHLLRIRKRPWWAWLLMLVWLTVTAVAVQSAVGSAREHERRAATISWIAAAAFGAGGLLVWRRLGR